jgi:glycosyltransferase involved in cell wall biosynthesis
VNELHLVLPGWVDDPDRPSGGSRYDRRLATALVGLGWQVRDHGVPGPWPTRTGPGLAALTATLHEIPDGATVLVDGAVASGADDVLLPLTSRLTITLLVHLPFGLVPDADQCVAMREGRVLRAADGVVTTSRWAADQVVSGYGVDPARVWVATPGADPAALTAGTSAGTNLLCVAALTPLKGHDVLVAALRGLSDLDWTCTCVGPLDVAPAWWAAVRQGVADTHLTRRVGFTGPLSPEALDVRYAAADLLVVPSRHETYGMVVSEALARGIPVIAPDVGGVPEALGYHAPAGPGVLVPPGDPAALAAALRRWLTEPGHRSRLRAGARLRRSELAGWDATAQAVLAAVTGEPRLARVGERSTGNEGARP